MQKMNLSISNEAVIPSVDSLVFAERPEAHLAVGIVAVGSDVIPGLEDEFQGYTLLRGNVYARQRNYMPVSELNDDGTETDVDDSRSVHFAVIENALESPRVVGAMRLIIKSHEDDAPLPIEHHYPNAFSQGPAAAMSTEVSRLIGRHERPRIQSHLKWLLFSAGVAYVMEHGLGPVYGAVETTLQRGLRIAGVPTVALGEAEFVEEFNASKLPIRVDIPGLAHKLESDQPELFSAMQSVASNFVYSGVSAVSERAASVDVA
jgi:N-acyl-L-homoserine lactone synthetase